MCRKLTVSCQRTVANKVSISDHYLTLSNIKIPCKEPGTVACRSGEAELEDFQNPPTTCAGAAAGHTVATAKCETVCHAALTKYGESLYRMNTGGLAKKGWFASWFGMREHGGKERSDKGLFVVTKDPEDTPYRLEESRARLDE